MISMKRLYAIFLLLVLPLGVLAARLPIPNFPDVDPMQWYYTGIDYVVRKGWITGYDNGYFGTNDAVSRAQLATILTRYDRYLAEADKMYYVMRIICLNKTNFLQMARDNIELEEEYRNALNELCNKGIYFPEYRCGVSFDLETGEMTINNQMCPI